jgi:putative PIN family toxin of toxin-antitoxin system
MRIVLDTSVLVAAIRSANGASRMLVEMVLQGTVKPLISVPLVLEYESVATRPEHLEHSELDEEAVVGIVKSFCIGAEHVHVGSRLRPQLTDPNDEFVLEAAVFGHADAIITMNIGDFQIAGRRFGIETLVPGEALERLREL